jgi:hypothetical protein
MTDEFNGHSTYPSTWAKHRLLLPVLKRILESCIPVIEWHFYLGGADRGLGGDPFALPCRRLAPVLNSQVPKVRNGENDYADAEDEIGDRALVKPRRVGKEPGAHCQTQALSACQARHFLRGAKKTRTNTALLPGIQT